MKSANCATTTAKSTKSPFREKQWPSDFSADATTTPNITSVQPKSNYDLIKERSLVFPLAKKPATFKKSVRIGIPHALYLAEEMPLWKHFFATLGVETVTSEGLKNAIKSGKKMAGAEFCAPMNAFFGHVQYLADKCDYIFLPVYLEAAKAKR